MNDEKRRAELRKCTATAAAGYATARAEVERDVGRPPRPGDVFLLAEAGALPVEWVVVAEEDALEGRLLVVAADDHPHLGVDDVGLAALDGTSAGGLTRVRCRLGVWLDARVLESGLRTGVLEAEVLEKVRRQREEVDAGGGVGVDQELEVEGDSEARDWIRGLERMLALLVERQGR